MSRSGYSDDCENIELYRANVDRAIKGRRGQAFLRELAVEMDAMPRKILISGELVDEQQDCCALGAVCMSRGINVAAIDYEVPEEVGNALGIAMCLAAEIEYENDEGGYRESAEERWQRMRRWVAKNTVASAAGE